ncbi:MAG TPA: ABC transporter substrate-binding protein [Acetobacteraceae bacterium]|nr:ABC transporter substrate-binding protein [Acetobacteraceae bacterium]
MLQLSRRSWLAGSLALATGGRPVRAAELVSLRLGLLHTLSPAPFYIAERRGYFRDQGIDLQFVFFEAAQPIAAAAVAGDIDVGLTALTGGYFNLAEKGALRVIGGGLHEEKGYEGTALLASDKAFDAGLTSPDKLPGHSVAITQYGSSFHYMIGRLAQKLGFKEESVVLRPVQSIANMMAAVGTSQVDATFAVASMAKPAAATGKAHIIAWIGDLIPYQLTALFAPQRMIEQKPALLHHFAVAYQQGVTDYRNAFLRLGPDGKPIHDAATDAAIPLITKYVFTGDPDARQKILEGVGYYPPGGALDVKDVLNQLAWFKQQGLVKGDADPNTLVTTEFLPAL